MALGHSHARFFVRILLVLLMDSGALAHDLWLMPGSVDPARPTTLSFSVHVGHPFPVGKGSAEASRIATSYALTSAGSIPVTTFTTGFRYLIGKVPVEKSGDYLVCLVTVPRYIELRPAPFDQYLQHEGLPHIHVHRQEAGTLGEPGREIYSRSVKTLVRAGTGADGVFTRPAGLDFEIVPSVDPLSLTTGSELPVSLLFEGKPLVDYPIQAGHEGFATEGFAQEARTDASGRAVFRIDRPGTWYIRSLHMMPATPANRLASTGETADWRSWWTSLTFKIVPPVN